MQISWFHRVPYIHYINPGCFNSVSYTHLLVNEPLAVNFFQKKRVVIDQKGVLKTNPLVKRRDSRPSLGLSLIHIFRPRKKSKKQMVNTAIILVIAVFTILYLLPIYWMGITSFRPEAKSMSWPPNFSPTGLVLDNYRVVFEQKSIFWYIRNSLIASIISVIFSLVIGCIAAFSFAFMRWKAKTKTSLLIWIISLRIMPPIAAAIPLFLIFARLRMIDTLSLIHI